LASFRENGVSTAAASAGYNAMSAIGWRRTCRRKTVVPNPCRSFDEALLIRDACRSNVARRVNVAARVSSARALCDEPQSRAPKDMSSNPRELTDQRPYPPPALRFEIQEASDILRMSRAQVYNRIAQGAIKAQKDGARTYITLRELERYVDSCEDRTTAEYASR
jgi:Helix-turn-helix domain